MLAAIFSVPDETTAITTCVCPPEPTRVAPPWTLGVAPAFGVNTANAPVGRPVGRPGAAVATAGVVAIGPLVVVAVVGAVVAVPAGLQAAAAALRTRPSVSFRVECMVQCLRRSAMLGGIRASADATAHDITCASSRPGKAQSCLAASGGEPGANVAQVLLVEVLREVDIDGGGAFGPGEAVGV